MKEQLSLLWTFLLKRTKVTILLAVFIIIAGVFSFVNIPRETTPQIDIPVGTITTIWPGASTKNVENLITKKIEQEIKNVEDIDEYTSTSKSGLSIIVVKFTQGTDQDKNIQNLKDKVNDVKRSLPSAIPDDPIVQKLSFSDTPIVSFAVSGNYAWSELKNFSKIISDDLKNVTDVKRVDVTGAPENEVHILINPLLLEKHNLSIGTVLQSVRSAHQNMPLGVVDANGESIEISVEAELNDPTDFANIPIKTQDGAVLKLQDLATIRREYKTFSIETYFQVTAEKSQPGVLIDVIKSAKEGNVIKMAASVEERLDILRNSNVIPRDLEVTKTFDLAKEIDGSMDTLIESGGQTLVLIVVILLIAVGWREAILAGVIIPLSMFVGITVLQATGNTFNNVSLFALVIAVGLLVDTAIVIVEGMSEAINEKKLPPYEAAIDTLNTFRWPLITGTLTTVFAFVPLGIFVDGVSGEFIKVIPITVTVVLLSALILSLFILPNFSVAFFESIPPAKHKEAAYLKNAKQWYEDKVRPILNSGWKSFAIILTSFVALISSVFLIISGIIQIEVFPGGDVSYLNIDFTYPTGTSISETRKLIPEVTQTLKPYFANNPDAKEKWIKNVVFTAGASQIKDGEKKPSDSENLLGTTINFVDEEFRDIQSPEITKELRKLFVDLPAHIEANFVEASDGPPSGAPIEIKLTGDNLVEMEQHVEIIKAGLGELKGLKQIDDSREDKTKQLTWKFDREKLNFFGLSPAQVMESLRAAVNGVEVVNFNEGDEEIDVSLRIDWDETLAWQTPKSLDILNKIPLQSAKGQIITLQEVATAEFSQQLSQLDHLDGDRTMKVTAYLEPTLTASAFQKDINAIITGIDKFPGEQIEMGGDSEEGNKLMTQSATAMVVALFLIFILLVVQFNSYSQPIIILALIPLSLTGVFAGFAAIGQTLSFPSMIGIVSLAGIIVNDAIVLMDQINVNRAKGLSIAEAAIKGAQQRFQPIFLTSITTVIGMLPLSLSDPMWSGLGFAIVFGMLLSTILCLLLVPCFLVLDENFSNFVARITRRVFKRQKNN